MSKIRYILGTTLAAVLMWVTAQPALALSYHWNRTHVNYGKIKVQFCDGSTKWLRAGDRTGKNVCRFWFPHDYFITAYVEETGTLLLDTCNVDDGYWKKLNRRSDTIRTANITFGPAICV